MGRRAPGGYQGLRARATHCTEFARGREPSARASADPSASCSLCASVRGAGWERSRLDLAGHPLEPVRIGRRGKLGAQLTGDFVHRGLWFFQCAARSRPGPKPVAAVFIGIAGGFALTSPDRKLTFDVKPVRQPPVGNGVVRVLMIEARWAIHIANDLRRAGHALDGVLKEVGLKRADLTDPENRITYAAYVGLIERAAMLLADPAYGLKLGASHDVRDNRPDRLPRPQLADVEQRAGQRRALRRRHQRGHRCISNGKDKDPRCAFARPMQRCAACGTIRSRLRHGFAGARELTRKRAVPLRVEFMHRGPTQSIDYERILGCPNRSMPSGTARPCRGNPAPARGRRRQQAAARARGRLPQDMGRPPRRQDLVHSVRNTSYSGWPGPGTVRRRGQPLQHEQQDAGAKARRTRRALPRARR